MNLLNVPILFSMPGPAELLLVFLIALLILGANRIPELARALGQAIRNFIDAVSGANKDSDDNDKNK